mgnify:FL=1
MRNEKVIDRARFPALDSPEKKLSEKARIGNEKSGARTLKDFCTAIGVS